MGLSMGSMEKEVRKFQRYPFNATAIIKMDGNEHQKRITTLANNISPIGMGLRTYTSLEKGLSAPIEVIFSGNQGKRQKDVIEGTVAWVSKLDTFYFMGIIFREKVNPSKHPNLYRHLMNIMNSNREIYS